jgi:hypothetical protein
MLFPSVRAGKALAEKPMRVQILFFGPLGASWIGLGVVLLVVPFIGLVRRRSLDRRVARDKPGG